MHERAVLAGGCFWGMQDLIRKRPGVISTRVGYTGGDIANATYRNHGTHAEAIEIVFDPAVTSYWDILEFFFQIHDPTTVNQQGNDRGLSYRSGIYYVDAGQKRIAQDTIADVEASGLWNGKVVTEVEPVGEFWEAEPDHQDYLEKRPGGYTCHFPRNDWVLPKRQKGADAIQSVLATVQSFVARGYDREYRVKDGNLFDLEVGSIIDPRTIRVDAALRLESGDDAEDASNIYAISDPATGYKGLLIDAFDVFDETCHRDLAERLLVNRETVPTGDQDVPSKHGLRKVYKREFDNEPERYVLRDGFPDFPPCPFGNAFSILGFDTAEQTYVWLVTSILRDSRLIRVPYQGEDVSTDQ